MKKHSLGQKGAILILTAFLLPFIIAFTGLAIDFGSAYVRRSQLQNAADASVLAGAYHLDDNQADNVVLKYLQDNLSSQFTNYAKQTGEDYPSDADTLNYSTTKSSDELDVTLRSSVNAYFLRVFNIDSIPVMATAKARISGTNKTIDDEMFNFGIVAAHQSAANYDPTIQKNPDYSILFDTEPVYVKGNIMTNGKIVFDNDQQNILDGKLYASSDVKKQGTTFTKDYWQAGLVRTKVFSPDVWGSMGTPARSGRWWLIELIKRWLGWYDDGDWSSQLKYFTFANTNGNAFTTETQLEPAVSDWPHQYGGKWQDISNSNLVQYRSSINISPQNNKGINALITKYKNMSTGEKESNHVFFDDSSNSAYGFYTRNDVEYPGLTNVYNKYYKVIIVSGDVDISLSYKGDPKDNEYAIIISLNGNINFHNGSKFNGILYAPNIGNNPGKGLITIDGGKEIHGSIVGQKILMNVSGQKIYWKNYFQTGGNTIPGTEDKKVSLIK